MNKISQKVYVPGQSAIPGVSPVSSGPLPPPPPAPVSMDPAVRQLDDYYAKKEKEQANHQAPSGSHAPTQKLSKGIEELKREIESLIKVTSEHKDQLDLDKALSSYQAPLAVSTDPLKATNQDIAPNSLKEVELSGNLGKNNAKNERTYDLQWDNKTTNALINACAILEIVGAKMKDSAIATFGANLKAFAQSVNTKASNIDAVAHSIATNLHAATGKINAFIKTLPLMLSNDERTIIRSNPNWKLDIPLSFYDEDGQPASGTMIPVTMTDIRSQTSFKTWIRNSGIKIVKEEDNTSALAADLPNGPAIVLNYIDSLLK